MPKALTQGAYALAPATPHVRRISLADLRAALHDGWEDFRASPTQLIFLCILYPITGLLVARAASGGDLLALLWPLVAGLSLVGPVAAVGLYEISRRREAGEATSWLTAFQVLRNPNFLSIAALGVLLMAVFVLWVGVARAIYDATLGELPRRGLGEIVHLALTTPEGHRLLLLGNGLGFLFALAVLVFTVVSVPMLLDRGGTLGTAIRTSLAACMLNPLPMACWGLIVAGLLLLGALPAFAGLAVAMPVLGHATWHLYRRLVE
jgi:uncharacterized membrane protein